MAQATPLAGSTAVPISGAAGAPQSIALPNAGGYSGTMLLTLANAASGTTAQVSVGTAPPPGVPAPTDADESLAFVGLDVSAAVALAGIPAFVFTVPGSVLQSAQRSPQSSDFSLLLDFFDPGNPSAGYQPAETCSLSGVTVTCSGGNALFNLLAKLLYVFRLKRHDLPTPTPTASAASGGTATITVPTPAPIACQPTTVATAVGATVVLDCTEPAYGGAFAIAITDPTIASVAQSDDVTYTFFNVTGLRAGTTTLSLQSRPGATISVQIKVSP